MMLSKIKNLKGSTGFLVGLLVAMLLVPSVAVAAGLKFTGIESSGGDKANVAGSGQLYTTNAPPNTLFNDGPFFIDSSSSVEVVNTPSGYGAVVTDLSTDFVIANGQGAGSNPAQSSEIEYYLATPGCESFISDVRYVNSSQPNDLEINFPTGLAVPNGEELCAIAWNGPLNVYVTASGYGVPSSSLSPAIKSLHGTTHLGPTPNGPTA